MDAFMLVPQRATLENTHTHTPHLPNLDNPLVSQVIDVSFWGALLEIWVLPNADS